MRDFFSLWYRPRVDMHREDWIYIGLLLLGSLWAFGLGLVLGFVWILFI